MSFADCVRDNVEEQLCPKNESPVVFTITKVGRLYTLQTNDTRVGTNASSPEIGARQLIDVMADLTARLNKHGYSVLFEVD